MRKISDTLREIREKKGLKLSDVERETKIKRIYLEEIEKGDFDKLPSESYALGFVKNYGKYLGLPASLTVPLFRREYSSKKHVPIIPEFRKKQHVFNRSAIFSPRGILIIAVVLLVTGYIIFQYSSLIFAPNINLESPRDGQRVSGNVVEVKGKTDPYATVTINNYEVYVGIDGSFSKSVYEFSGDSKITIVAKNRFGKTSEKIVDVKVD
ncbi:MAG TPA: helix-turn-helix domain-containing protein [Patescibacteria group bacterium]|nr:helix-turn-helix domain-containing protein [Patescibacteria group bacterium]